MVSNLNEHIAQLHNLTILARIKSTALSPAVSPRIRLKSPAHIGVRHRLHQFPDFRFKKVVRDDERADGRAQVAVACGDGLIDGGVQLGSVVFAQ